MKTAVVTGATGFVGSAFVEHLLKNNYFVYAVVRNPDKLKISGDNLKIIVADFDEYGKLGEMIENSDYFYHFAWDGAYGQKTADYNVQMKNMHATFEAMEQAVKMNCKKFIFAGTIAELEIREHLDKNVCSPRGTCIYASAKLNTEMICKVLATKYNIEFNSGLFANIIGEGDESRRSTNFILNKFIHREKPMLVEGNGKNDWLYIKDAVRLILAMGEKGKNKKTYYIGHNELWTLKEIISKARDIVAPDLELKFGDMKDEFLTDYSYINTNELYNDTGVKAEYSFDDMIKRTEEWVRKLNF